MAGSPFADPRGTMQPQPTGFGNYQQPGMQQGGINAALPPALIPQRTGFPNQPPQIQQNGINQFQPQQTGFQPAGLQMQPTGFQPSFQLQPTGFPQTIQPQPTGFGPTNGFGSNNFPPVPPIPQQTASPLVPQKTGAPDIKFGVKKLQPQPTGRRANLSQASELISQFHIRTKLTRLSTRQSIWFLSEHIAQRPVGCVCLYTTKHGDNIQSTKLHLYISTPDKYQSLKLLDNGHIHVLKV